MGALEIVFGIVLLVMAAFLIVAVLLQSGKSEGLSGTIAGGADNFFGKNASNTKEKKLSLITSIVAVVFVVVVIVMYAIVS